jgi:predicted TPR repeat methyltransferase
MIDKARERNIYDDLLVGDLHEVLHSRRGDVDLVLGADVFGYVGDLSAVLTAAAAAMAPGALIAFSVEKHDGPEDFILRESRRFAHSRRYIEHMLKEKAIELVEVTEAVLRKDGRERIVGLIVVGRMTQR